MLQLLYHGKIHTFIAKFFESCIFVSSMNKVKVIALESGLHFMFAPSSAHFQIEINEMNNTPHSVSLWIILFYVNFFKSLNSTTPLRQNELY